MPQSRKKKTAERKLGQAAERSAERALREERLAVGAIIKVFLAECANLERPLARIEGMVRRAEADPRVTLTTRRVLLDAARFIRTAVERELRKPQSLLDPHVGHVDPDKVEALAAPALEQLGFGAERPLADTVEAHTERSEHLTAAQAMTVKLMQAGACSDEELYRRYHRARLKGEHSLVVGLSGLRSVRVDLTRMGRIKRVGTEGGVPTWDLIERDLLEAK